MIKINSILKNEVRIYLTDATEVSQKVMDIHNTKPLASLAISTAMSVYSSFFKLKTGLPTSVVINGNGPLGKLIIETDGENGIKGLVVNPDVVTEYDETRFNEIPIQLGIGDGGTLKIVHSLGDSNFGGEVKLANCDVTTDLAYYFDQSEQVKSAVISSVVLEKVNKLKHSKSIIFQMLPKHTEKDIIWVENWIKSDFFAKNTIEDIIKNIDGIELDSYELNWNCNCSKEKMLNAAKTLSEVDRNKIIEEDGNIEVGCDFCKKKYQFTNKDF